jgi:hypothetical protein
VIALALLCALAQSAGEGAELVGVVTGARWEVSAARVEAGEPFEATLVVEHRRGETVEVDFAPLEADAGWLLLGPPERVHGEPQRLAGTAARWSARLAAFEPGERELPLPRVTLADAGGAREELAVRGASVDVAGALAPGEDAPRPPRGFRPADVERAGWPWPWLTAAAALLPVLAALAWLALRRRAPPPAPATARERLERLGQRDLDAPAQVRELHYELTALVREELDRRAGASRAALTDEEWLAAAAASLPVEAAAELAALLRASAEVKYGAHQPTPWAVRETLERARRVLAAGESAKAAA